jgi:hypothetical protein
LRKSRGLFSFSILSKRRININKLALRFLASTSQSSFNALKWIVGSQFSWYLHGSKASVRFSWIPSFP